MALPPRVRRALLLRSFLVQGSWNYHTLIGTGFAFMLLPALRSTFRGDEQALRAAVARHSAVFNSHPYLAGIAAGAVARLEADGADPAIIGRFKDALRSSLGALGDQVVWSAWRPASALLALALLLAGVPWWIAVGAFLVSYNALHLWMRVWALDLGIHAASAVGQALRAAPLQRWGQRATDGGAVLAGFCAALALGRAGADPIGLLLGAVALGLGLLLGARLRIVVSLLLGLCWFLGLLMGALRGTVG